MVRARDETRDRLRWESVEDGGSQPQLFGSSAERVTHPEFRNLEFIHVRAKTIINEVPAASRMPFRHTINVYRGCSHACAFCFARPSHEYLNLDAGRDFERVIVVKVNAVERLRAEIASSRWGGDHIAMGTNTDPYQRAEGRYRLTRGVLEVLTAAGNPFSLLTKSSLVVRDLDILKEANERTDIAVNFSIATLDPDVWRATEPGAPNPRSRVEALAAVREAGIPAGVLVAPVQPGISDSRDQLAEVVKACVEAGATSISPITLHLRPGVKKEFMPWLEEQRPDLLPLYHRLYPRSYAPKDEQARIAGMVRELVEEYGGTTRSPAGARRVRSSSPPSRNEPDPDETAEQLALGL